MNTHYAVDLDGTIDTDPAAFSQLMTDWRQTGATVTVLTGNDQADSCLQELGVSPSSYDQVVILPDVDLPAEKAAWCTANAVTVLVDNNPSNCATAAAAGILAFSPTTVTTVRSAQRASLEAARKQVSA